MALLAALCIFNVVLTSALEDGLFLQFHDKTRIPLAMLYASLLTAGVTLFTRRLMFRLSGPQALRLILVGLAVVSAVVAALNVRPTAPTTFALFLTSEVATTLGAAAVWSYFQAPLDSARLRTVMPRLGVWAGVGGLTAGALTPLLLRNHVAPQRLLPLSALAWLAAALLVRADHVPSKRRARSRIRLGRPLFRLPLVRWLALSAAGAAWLGLLIQFQNRVALQAALPPAQIASFMAALLAAASVLGVAVQALVTTRVLERWGVGVALAILPAALATLIGIYLWVPLFGLIAAALFSDKTLRPNLARPAESCVAGALPPEERLAATLLIAGVVAPLLKALGALALCLAVGVRRDWLLLAALALALGLTLLAFWWGRIYARGLERTLAEGTVGGGADEPLAPLIDGPRLSILLAAIDSGKHHARELALELLLPHRTGIVARALWARLESPDEAVRILALRWLAAQPTREAEAHLRARFLRADTSDAERIALIAATRAPAALLDGEWERWLAHPNLELRCQVVRALHADPAQRARAQTVVATLLAGSAPERLAGLQLARELGVAGLAAALRAAVDHPHTGVRREALAALAALDPRGAPPILLAALAQPRLAAAAARALATLGEPALPESLERLAAAPRGSALRRNLLRALGLLRSPLAVPALLDELQGPEPDERLEAIKSLRLVARQVTALDGARLQAFVARELGRGLELMQARERLRAQLPPGGLLQRELAAQIAATQERLSRALALLAPPGTMARIFWALRSARSPHRDQARELLRTLLGAGPVLQGSLKLLDEDSPWPPLSTLPCKQLPDGAAAIAWLTALDDRWLHAALRHDLALQLPAQEDPMEASLDTILFLKDVTLFATLTNPQLVEVARLAEKSELGRGQVLFDAGDTVDYFYIVRSGSLRVRKGDDEVARIGAGECVGEMAVLAGTDRSATVEAVEPSQLLRFDAEDFLVLLETYTEIGRGLLRALVLRLAQQTRPVHVPRSAP